MGFCTIFNFLRIAAIKFNEHNTQSVFTFQNLKREGGVDKLENSIF